MSRGYIVPIGGAEDKVRDPKILARFVELCGGKEARIAVIPTASRLHDTGRKYRQTFERIGAREVEVLPFEKRADCRRPEWLRTLEEVDGVFLTGGNQLRLSTTVGGTEVAEMLRRRNREGLHVAGTSAGAAFIAEHMIAFGAEGSTPRGDLVTLSPGLGLTDLLIIDQHFRQRDRLGRLLTALAYNPRPIGIGLDEDTAAFLDAGARRHRAPKRRRRPRHLRQDPLHRRPGVLRRGLRVRAGGSGAGRRPPRPRPPPLPAAGVAATGGRRPRVRLRHRPRRLHPLRPGAGAGAEHGGAGARRPRARHPLPAAQPLQPGAARPRQLRQEGAGDGHQRDPGHRRRDRFRQAGDPRPPRRPRPAGAPPAAGGRPRGGGRGGGGDRLPGGGQAPRRQPRPRRLETRAVQRALETAAAGDLLLLFCDAVRRSWQQITGFVPGAAPAPAESRPPAVRLEPPELPVFEWRGSEKLIRDQRGVRLARESED